MVRTPAFQAGDHGFDPRRPYRRTPCSVRFPRWRTESRCAPVGRRGPRRTVGGSGPRVTLPVGPALEISAVRFSAQQGTSALRVRGGADRRSPARRTRPSAPTHVRCRRQGGSELTPELFDAITPRDEVLTGTLTDAGFAASLVDVVEGSGPEVYRDAAAFFSATYPSAGLRALLNESLGRASGTKPESAPVTRLETNLGGGQRRHRPADCVGLPRRSAQGATVHEEIRHDVHMTDCLMGMSTDPGARRSTAPTAWRRRCRTW